MVPRAHRVRLASTETSDHKDRLARRACKVTLDPVVHAVTLATEAVAEREALRAPQGKSGRRVRMEQLAVLVGLALTVWQAQSDHKALRA